MLACWPWHCSSCRSSWALAWARRDDTKTSTLFILGGLALSGGVLFVLRELWARFPAVNLRLFRMPAFAWLGRTGFLNTLGLFGGQFMIPIFLQMTFHAAIRIRLMGRGDAFLLETA